MELIQSSKKLGAYINSKATTGRRPNHINNSPWKSLYRVGKRSMFLGTFATEKEALCAYDNAAYHCRLARGKQTCKLNYPGDYDEHQPGTIAPLPWRATRFCLHELHETCFPTSRTAQLSANEIAPLAIRMIADVIGFDAAAVDGYPLNAAIAKVIDKYI